MGARDLQNLLLLRSRALRWKQLSWRDFAEKTNGKVKYSLGLMLLKQSFDE